MSSYRVAVLRVAAPRVYIVVFDYINMPGSCDCDNENWYSNAGYCFDQNYETSSLVGGTTWKKKDEACPCTLIPCENVELCGVKQPGWCYDRALGSTSENGKLCMHCDSMRFGIRNREDQQQRHHEGTKPWQRLEFKDATEPCPVCLEEKDRVVKFPHCTHYFCKECTWLVLHGHGELDYHLSPVPYGCPPCPNGCENPIRGVQCFCLEYFNDDEDEGPPGVVQQWEEANPEAAAEFNTNESASRYVWDHPEYCSGKCPVCRSSIHNTNLT